MRVSLVRIGIGFLGGLLMAAGLLAGRPARADQGFLVTLTTAPLVGHPAGPFSLDFQLTDGDGTPNNIVNLSNFSFNGGNVSGPPLTVLGGASGDLSTGVTLTDSTFLNEFEQGFTPGGALSFEMHLTNGFVGGVTPDLFTFAILDNTGSELPTLSPLSVFLQVSFTGVTPTIEAFDSDPAGTPVGGGDPVDIPAPTVTALQGGGGNAPEPGSLALVALAGGVASLCWCRRNGRRVKVA